MIAVCLLVTVSVADPTRSSAFAAREPGSVLTPEARPFNDRGVALVMAGQHAAGVAELERAYALLPDPVLHRKGRSKVLGSIRGTLLELHAATGDPAHLERLRGHLLRYIEALLVALGETATAADVELALASLRDISAMLTALHPVTTAPSMTSRTDTTNDPRASATLKPTPTPAQPVLEPPHHPTEPAAAAADGRRLRLAGGLLIGVGVATIGVMTGTAVASADHRGKLRSLTDSLSQPGTPASPAVWQQGEYHHDRAGVFQAVAITTGVVGGVALASGIALRIVGKRRAPDSARRNLTPLLAPGVVGVHLGGAF